MPLNAVALGESDLTTGSQTARTYRFSDLTLDTGRRSVSRGGSPIDLSARSYEFLVALVRAAPNLLSHNELVRHVWGGRVVSADTITQRAKLLRDALGDNAKDPRYILVARGQGYRLIPEVVSSRQTPTFVPRLTAMGVAACFLIVGLISLFALSRYVPSSRDAVQPETPRYAASVAVLPFLDLSPDGQDSNFVEALHNDLLTYLAKLDNLRIIPRDSVLEYRDESPNFCDIGSQLGVESVLQGSVQRSEETVRVNVQLVDAVRDEHLWAETYERDFLDQSSLSIQEDIAQVIARALQVELTPEKVARLSALPATNIRAYEAYLAGIEYLNSPNDLFGERPGAEVAAELLERAVAADSQFTLGWAALARSHAAMFFFEFDSSGRRLEMARQAIERAEALASDASGTSFDIDC